MKFQESILLSDKSNSSRISERMNTLLDLESRREAEASRIKFDFRLRTCRPRTCPTGLRLSREEKKFLSSFRD